MDKTPTRATEDDTLYEAMGIYAAMRKASLDQGWAIFVQAIAEAIHQAQRETLHQAADYVRTHSAVERTFANTSEFDPTPDDDYVIMVVAPGFNRQREILAGLIEKIDVA